ncbi:MAG: hypothetical protein AAGC96_20335, partial [Pseudomonadota bacterium]
CKYLCRKNRHNFYITETGPSQLQVAHRQGSSIAYLLCIAKSCAEYSHNPCVNGRQANKAMFELF